MGSPTASHSRVNRIAVVGLGNVGRLIADMLVERGFEVRGVDADASRATGEHASVMDVSDPAALGELFAGVDAVISCLPYYLNAGGCHGGACRRGALPGSDRGRRHLAHRQAARRELGHDLHAALRPRPGFICVLGGRACGQARDRRPDRAAGRRTSAQPEQRGRLCVQLVSRRGRQRVPERLRAAARGRAR